MANGAKSRSKGKTGEREIARKLAPWWGEFEPGTKFVTTPSSGGWASAHVRGEFKVAGDLCTSSDRWPFTVEVKRREGWSVPIFIIGRPSPVWDWWRQCVRAAAEEDREPMLWARKNRGPWIVLLPERILVTVAARHDVEVDVVFRKLRRDIDDGDVKPAVIFGDKFLSLPASSFALRRRR